MTSDAIPREALLRLPEVSRLTGLSESVIYERIAAGVLAYRPHTATTARSCARIARAVAGVSTSAASTVTTRIYAAPQSGFAGELAQLVANGSIAKAVHLSHRFVGLLPGM